MKLDLEEMTSELAQAVRGEVAVRSHGDGVLRVETPFQFNDGDHLVIRLRENGDDRLEWTDLGHTFMHLSYSMEVGTLGEGKRAELLEDALRRLDVEDREGELVLPTSRADLGRTLLAFAQAVVHVSDLEYLTQERVASTFREDFERTLADAFGSRAQFRYADPERDPERKYEIDCLLNGIARPVAVFAIPGDTAGRDATIVLHAFRDWARPLFSTAIYEDQEKVNRRVVARFSDVVDKQFSSLYGNQDEIVRYLGEQIEQGER